ncbi:hypothetical protein, partial [Paraburkholderia youngii]|uniref:hypothetical protein n=1 Tax=Paraburkholderia youngii TaxID=2782701 RepID=UPI001C3D9919
STASTAAISGFHRASPAAKAAADLCTRVLSNPESVVSKLAARRCRADRLIPRHRVVTLVVRMCAALRARFGFESLAANLAISMPRVAEP